MKLSPEKKKKLMATMLGVGIVLVTAWYLGDQLVVKSKESNTRELERTEGEVRKRSNDILKERTAREQAKSYQQYLTEWEAKMPTGNPETWMVKEMVELAGTQKIQLANTALQPMKEISNFKFRDQPYQLLGFRLEFLADFNQIGKFLEALENSQPLMEVEDLTIAAGSARDKHVHTVSMVISEVTKQ